MVSPHLVSDCSILARCRRCSVQYVATQCGVVYELGERRETDLVGQVCNNKRTCAWELDFATYPYPKCDIF